MPVSPCEVVHRAHAAVRVLLAMLNAADGLDQWVTETAIEAYR